VAPLGELWRWAKPLLKKTRTELIFRDIIETSRTGNRIQAHGLICLKGGELEEEIAESNTRPAIYPIQDYLYDEYFLHKYILYVDARHPNSLK
jgi:16S rRNA (guanine527-N7)-methyltransferase